MYKIQEVINESMQIPFVVLKGNYGHIIKEHIKQSQIQLLEAVMEDLAELKNDQKHVMVIYGIHVALEEIKDSIQSLKQ